MGDDSLILITATSDAIGRHVIKTFPGTKTSEGLDYADREANAAPEDVTVGFSIAVPWSNDLNEVSVN